jgi:hypothetical protein
MGPHLNDVQFTVALVVFWSDPCDLGSEIEGFVFFANPR